MVCAPERPLDSQLFLLAFFLPLIGIICAAAARPNIAKLQQRGVAVVGMRQCPKCPELAKAKAKFCRSCGTSLGRGCPIGPAAHFPATDPIVPKVFMVVIAYAILGALALANLAMQP